MKCLVLGSSGQIGNALSRYLENKGHIVTRFDIAEHSFLDLRHQGILDSYLATSDFVFFLAFDVGGSTYLKTYQNTFQFLDNNTKLMAYTFESLKKYNTPFLFASSQMSNMTFSSYGVLKSLGEHYTKCLGGIVVKFWNVYGIEHDPTKTHVITDFVKMAINTGEIRMRTDGEEERQFLYAVDCSEALEILANQYKQIPRDKELHITSFEWIKIIDFAKETAKICGNVKIISGKDKDTVQQGKRNNPDPYILSFWKPKTNIATGITHIVNYYKKETK